MLYCGILCYTVVYCAILQYTVVYCGILWYTVTAVYCGILWYTMVYYLDVRLLPSWMDPFKTYEKDVAFSMASVYCLRCNRMGAMDPFSSLTKS